MLKLAIRETMNDRLANKRDFVVISSQPGFWERFYKMTPEIRKSAAQKWNDLVNQKEGLRI
jgi:hypothetical protein